MTHGCANTKPGLVSLGVGRRRRPPDLVLDNRQLSIHDAKALKVSSDQVSTDRESDQPHPPASRVSDHDENASNPNDYERS